FCAISKNSRYLGTATEAIPAVPGFIEKVIRPVPPPWHELRLRKSNSKIRDRIAVCFAIVELDRKLNPFPRASAREAPAKPQAINFFSQRADNFPIFRIYGFYMA